MSGYRAKNRFRLEVQEGDAFTQDFTVPAEISLTGKSIRMQARSNASAPVAIITLSTTANTITKSGQNFTLIFTPASTTGKVGTYPADIKVYTDADDPLTIAIGDLVILPQITQLP